MRETTAENSTKSTSSVEGRRVHLDLLRRLAGSGNDKALRRRRNAIESGWRLKHLLQGEGSSVRRGRVEEVGDERLARWFIRERHWRWDSEQKGSKNSNNGEEEKSLSLSLSFSLSQTQTLGAKCFEFCLRVNRRNGSLGLGFLL